MSKLGFPKSDPSLEVISLDHGLEAHATKRCGIAHVHLAQDLGIPGVTADEPLFNVVHHDLPFIHLLRTF
jgi:hypothetical protein